jgi:hypothetical protein
LLTFMLGSSNAGPCSSLYSLLKILCTASSKVPLQLDTSSPTRSSLCCSSTRLNPQRTSFKCDSSAMVDEVVCKQTSRLAKAQDSGPTSVTRVAAQGEFGYQFRCRARITSESPSTTSDKPKRYRQLSRLVLVRRRCICRVSDIWIVMRIFDNAGTWRRRSPLYSVSTGIVLTAV